MNYLKQFQKHLANNDFPSVLTLWEEYCLGDEIEPEELQRILKGIKESNLSELFGRHVEKGLLLWEKVKEKDLNYDIFKLIIDLQTTNPSQLATQIIHFLQNHFPNDPYFGDKIRLIGLRDCKNFQGAISNYELLTHMKKGSYVFHSGGWGVGEIMEVSFLREQLSIEFDYVSGKKDLSFQNAFNTLIPLPNDHFLSLRFGNPDELEKEAKKNPIKLIHTLLKDLGPLNASEIKEELYELVIPRQEWARWWQTTRSKIKKDTLIESPSDTRKPFVLREGEVLHEETLQKALEKKPDAQTLIQMVYTFFRDFPSTLKNETFRKELQENLKEVLSVKELTDGEELQIHFFLQDLATDKKESAVEELIKRFPSPEKVIEEIKIIAFKKRTLLEIYKLRSNWATIFLNLLLEIEQNLLKDYILNELIKAKKEAEIIQKIEYLLNYPIRHPHTLIWYFQKIMKNEALAFGDQKGKNQFLEAFLILLNQLEQQAGFRNLIKKMHNFLTTGRYANIRKIFQEADKATVQEFLLLATKCLTLTDHDIKIFHSLAQVVHPSLGKLNKKYGIGEKEKETCIWTTSTGYQKIKERIHKISTVETVENAKEIEVARSHGDLRENAEFKAALERRDRLQSELKTLSDQFNQARILTKEEVKTDAIDVGVIVDFEGEDGSHISYTLLGPWDANPEKHILSFQSKLAQSMIGRKVGETIKIQGKNFKISKLKNYFDKA